MSYGICSYCKSEIKYKKNLQKFDDKLFCNNTHKKLYCLNKIKNNNFDEKYINELIDIETLKFKNSNFIIEDLIKTKIIRWIWNKKGLEEPKCLTCEKNLFDKYISENKFYNPFKEEIKFCSYKCSNKYRNKKNKVKKEDIFIEAYKLKKIELLKDSKNRINSNAIKILKKKFNITTEDLYKHFYNIEGRCKVCGKKTKFINFNKGFQKYCSRECIFKDKKIINKIQNKIKETCLEKYGVKNHTQKELKNIENLNEDFVRKNFINEGYFDNKKFMDYFNCSVQCASNYKSKFKIKEPVKQKWQKQNEILEFIKENYNGEILTNTRKTIPNKELDIYIPEFKFAIEYDGIFFHSQGNHPFFKNIDKNYHLEKTELCEQNDIHLFHIFSNEWLDEIKQDIWKSKILLKLKSNKIKKYNARDGIIKEIDTKIARQFLKENHLQGYSESKIKLGFFINNELLAVMTFGKSRFKNNEYELIRFASKKYTTIRGLFGKFLKYFENNYIEKLNIKKLISFGNRRWVYKNNVYQKFMKLEKIIEPNFYVFNDELNLYHRIKFQKHKLKNILNNYNENLSAKENIFNNGYRIIYDAGNFKYYKKYIFK